MSPISAAEEGDRRRIRATVRAVGEEKDFMDRQLSLVSLPRAPTTEVRWAQTSWPTRCLAAPTNCGQRRPSWQKENIREISPQL